MPDTHLREAAAQAQRLAKMLAPNDEARQQLLDLAASYTRQADDMKAKAEHQNKVFGPALG